MVSLRELLQPLDAAVDNVSDTMLLHLEVGHAKFCDLYQCFRNPITSTTTQPQQFFFHQLRDEIIQDWRHLLLQLVLVVPKTPDPIQILDKRLNRYERLWIACSNQAQKPHEENEYMVKFHLQNPTAPRTGLFEYIGSEYTIDERETQSYLQSIEPKSI